MNEFYDIVFEERFINVLTCMSYKRFKSKELVGEVWLQVYDNYLRTGLNPYRLIKLCLMKSMSRNKAHQSTRLFNEGEDELVESKNYLQGDESVFPFMEEYLGEKQGMDLTDLAFEGMRFGLYSTKAYKRVHQRYGKDVILGIKKHKMGFFNNSSLREQVWKDFYEEGMSKMNICKKYHIAFRTVQKILEYEDSARKISTVDTIDVSQNSELLYASA